MDVPFPEITDDYLISMVQEIGWCLSGGMGAVPLTASEIQSWCEMMDEELSPWEFRVIRRMSSAYVSGTNASEAPYEPVTVMIGLASAGMVGD